MKRGPVFCLALSCLALGFFAGREHLKYQIRSSLGELASGFRTAFAGLGDGNIQPGALVESDRTIGAVSAKSDSVAIDYAANKVRLYELHSSVQDLVLYGTCPVVEGKIQNTGSRSLKEVEVTVYFLDQSNKAIAEQKYYPVLSSSYHGNQTFKPGYIKDFRYRVENVPSEWVVGRIKAGVRTIKFAD